MVTDGWSIPAIAKCPGYLLRMRELDSNALPMKGKAGECPYYWAGEIY